ncbi:hypothetical protein [Streptomyces sp. NPDC088794]|uniref:hypothetical protein n=1 Tax=Streptomyces sp. NPDC088794 TaxID=3365902 RepID=UPI0038091AC6
MTLAIDFDGPIHTYSRGWRDGSIYDPPTPGAIDGLHRLLEHDAVFVFTSREPEQVMPWLEQQGLNVTIDDRCGTCHGEGGGQEVDADDRPTQPAWECPDCDGSGTLAFWNLRGQLLVTNRKLPADAYLDDRAVRFTDWPQALRHLNVEPRLLACGLCHEEWGEEVHPHPECPLRTPDATAGATAARHVFQERFDRDPHALAWARTGVQEAVDRAEQCAQNTALPDTTRDSWTKTAFFMRHQLLTRNGVVHAAFDQRLPAFLAAIDPAAESETVERARRFVIRHPDRPDVHGIEFPSGWVIAHDPDSGLVAAISMTEMISQAPDGTHVHWADEPQAPEAPDETPQGS